MSLESEYRLSKGAQKLVAKAEKNGVDPIPYVRQALTATQEAGRHGKKVGNFGPGARIFKFLKDQVFQARNRRG